MAWRRKQCGAGERQQELLSAKSKASGWRCGMTLAANLVRKQTNSLSASCDSGGHGRSVHLAWPNHRRRGEPVPSVEQAASDL